MAVEVTSLVWQLVEATAYKICHLVGLIKSQCYSLHFLRKEPTKNWVLSRLKAQTLSRSISNMI